MAGEVSVTVSGLSELTAVLRSMPDKLRKKVLRNALAAGGRLVRDAARRGAPVISPSDPAVQRGIRKPGTLRNAIAVRTSKQARRQGNVGVFVNVRPAKGAVFRGGQQVRASQRGAKNPNDPFYWRWLEFGRQGRAGTSDPRRAGRRAARRAVGPIGAVKFLRTAAQQLDAALERFKSVLGPQIARLNFNPKDPL